MAIRLYAGKRRKLKTERGLGETYGFAGSTEIVDGVSTGVIKHVNIDLGEDYYLEIDREDLIKAYEFAMRNWKR